MKNISVQSILTMAVLSIFGVVCSQSAMAKSTGSMDVKAGVYKLKSGSKLPIKGPVVQVYAEGASTKYSHVANTHQTLPVLVKYTASCSNKGKISGGSVSIGDASKSIDSGDGFSSESLWVNVPYSTVSSVGPVKHCNNHAKTLSIQQDKTLEKIIQKGFVMKVPNVMSTKGTVFCNAAGLGKGDVDSDSADNLSVFLQCVANPKARAPRSSSSTKGSKPKPDVGDTTTNFKAANIRAKTPNYVGDCPASMIFDGSITAKAKGEIEYQIIGDGNYKTPVKTMKFNQAGSQNFQWTRMVRKPDVSSQLSVAGSKPSPNQIKGWMQLKVIYRLRNNIASTKKTWFSKQQKFSVTCGKAKVVSFQIKEVKPIPSKERQ